MTGQSTAPPSWGKDPACWLCKMSAAVQVCIQWGLYEQPRPGGAHSLWHGVLPRVRSCADVRCAAVLQCVLLAGPATAASAAGFYGTLLQSKRWWADELEDEGVMRLALPSPVRPRIAACALGGTPRSVRVCPSGTPRSASVPFWQPTASPARLTSSVRARTTRGAQATTNGTWLATQAVASLVRAMVTRKDTWGQRYGVVPGYGINMQDGFEDTFTASSHARMLPPTPPPPPPTHLNRSLRTALCCTVVAPCLCF